MNVASSCATEGLDRENLALLHLGLVVAFDDRHALAAVDAVLDDVVAVQVPDTFDW